MKKIDGELFYQIFSLALCLILLGMAIEFRTAVEKTVRSLEYTGCAEICTEIYLLKTGFEIPNISVNLSEFDDWQDQD